MSPRRNSSRQRTTTRTWEPAWDPDYDAPAAPRYVPDDWQTAWVNTTRRICDIIWQRWAYRLYGLDPLARDDFADWLWVEAAKFAAKHHPANRPDAEYVWGASLYVALHNAARWHWAVYHGKSAYQDRQKRWQSAEIGSLDALVDAVGSQTMHRSGYHPGLDEGALWGWRPITPEGFVLLLEIADRTADDPADREPRKDPRLCHEPGCNEPIRTAELCSSHYTIMWRRWKAGTCTADDCDKPVAQAGLCNKHYRAAREANPNVPRCIEPGCQSAADGRQLCHQHRDQWRQQGRELPPRRAPKAPTPCTIPGCDAPAFAKSMCRPHYRADRRGRGLPL